MSMKSFSTTQKQQETSGFEGAEPIEFDVDGETFTAYPPTGSQLALALASTSQHSSGPESIRGMIDFLDGILDEDGQARFRERLMDRNDPFDFDNVADILAWLTEQWSAHPTKQPSDYRPSQRAGGRKSTAPRRSKASTS